MPSDPSRILREYALEPLRRGLRVAGARVLVVAAAGDVAELAGTAAAFEAAWVELDSVAGIDLRCLGREVARVLKPGGRLVCVVPGANPLPRLVGRAVLGDGRAGPGEAVPGQGASLSAWRRAFQPAIAWSRTRGFGTLVPADGWSRLHPLASGALAAVEHVLGSWPLLRALGERVVLEGVRR